LCGCLEGGYRNEKNQSSQKTILSSPSYQTGTIATTKDTVQPTQPIYNEGELFQ
ncbi:hypothetical protein ACOME3_002836, partial [Neoechinorhynchus agilis]